MYGGSCVKHVTNFFWNETIHVGFGNFVKSVNLQIFTNIFKFIQTKCVFYLLNVLYNLEILVYIIYRIYKVTNVCVNTLNMSQVCK